MARAVIVQPFRFSSKGHLRIVKITFFALVLPG